MVASYDIQNTNIFSLEEGKTSHCHSQIKTQPSPNRAKSSVSDIWDSQFPELLGLCHPQLTQ